MKYRFSDESLEKFYTEGKHRKFGRFQDSFKRRFVMRINSIDSSTYVQDLYYPPSMHFKKIEGYKNRFSIRIDTKWRLEFEIDFDDDDKSKGDVTILKISNHYEGR